MPAELARTAYEAWRDARQAAGANVRREWPELLEDERGAWRTVVRATLEAFAGGGPRVEPGTADGEERFG